MKAIEAIDASQATRGVATANRFDRFDRFRRSYHLLALLFLALVIYQPWTNVPFPLVDYSEFLTPLREGGSLSGGMRRIIAYYHSHGRSSYLAYFQLALNWAVLGDRPVAWNFAVFTYAAGAVAAVWLLLVRIGSARMAATLAAALLIVATQAIPVWLDHAGPTGLLYLQGYKREEFVEA